MVIPEFLFISSNIFLPLENEYIDGIVTAATIVDEINFLRFILIKIIAQLIFECICMHLIFRLHKSRFTNKFGSIICLRFQFGVTGVSCLYQKKCPFHGLM